MSELPVPLTQRRRRPRLNQDELRRAMFEAAQRLVYEMGVTMSLEDLGFEDVIRAAGVSRSSAYRLWPYKGDFVGELLAFLATPSRLGTAAFDQGTIDLALETVTANWHLAADADGRRALLMETVRVAALQNFQAMAAADEWRIYIALVATCASTRSDAAKANITAALVSSEAQFVLRMCDFYTNMMAFLGLRLRRPDLGVEHLATAAAAVMEGLVLRKVMLKSAGDVGTSEFDEASRVALKQVEGNLDLSIPGAGLNGESAEWSLPAIAFLALLDAVAEPDPDFEPHNASLPQAAGAE